ncbi:MAG: hypothetical protein COT89_00735 [Candidatus Colwellbacteria bacterium CG10_big_fil_rev_8_21_14_0_10_42_22]|uniref:Band 7 domain-containing protein n=1 Tax=Candidatus Colwellbacteria bacterium CG10_big_fil_rev_8_21_14_0_10_42_22 TaxID=1974540 RepID=A0A2H0VIT3_9BACT|nr:MAG: hypothetical protein COT89_00735 [Candidatus Colwellbacteria bacterium CG10_big_fil_rev_8_21_14_0_10_42_22]
MIIYGTLISIAVAVAGQLTVWSRPVISKGHIVVFQGKVFYPGERFVMRPWFFYDPIFFKENGVSAKFPVGKHPKQLFSADVVLDINTAKMRGVRSLDGDLSKEVLDKVRREVLRRGQTESFVEIVNNPREFRFDAAGFPAVWSGGATFVAEVKSPI